LILKVLERWDLTVIEGHRTMRRQKQLYITGKSKLDGQPGRRGKHMSEPSKAVDMAPYPIDWQDTDRFYEFGEYVRGVADALDIPIRWGGDWDGDTDKTDQTFNDLVHFELLEDE
jgi:peptidoglycan L-alanyl-D-glutamate endopeptidase CwlK